MKMINFDLTNSEGKELAPIDHAKHQLMQYRAQVQATVTEAQAMEVESAEQEQRAAEFLARIKALLKRIEAEQRLLIEEPQAYVRAVQNFTLPLRKDLERAATEVKRKIESWAYQRELARREAEKKAQEEAARIQREMDLRAKKAGVEPVTIVPPVLPERKEPVRTESGTTSYITVWDYEVVDVSKIPARYLVADPTNRAAVMDAIRAGVREIPGLRIYERVQARVRA